MSYKKIILVFLILFFSIRTEVSAQLEEIEYDYLVEKTIEAIDNENFGSFKEGLSEKEINLLKSDSRFSNLFTEPTTQEIIFSQGVNLDDASRQTGLTKEELINLAPNDAKKINFNYEPPEAISCFDYYDFGSVNVNLFKEIDTLVYGNEYLFNASVINNNLYPVVEIDIYARVYRKQLNKNDSFENGDHIVDQFLIAENISIDSNEKKEIPFNWELPDKIKTGEYYMTTYVVSSDRYNMQGLTFTDDINGPKTFFDIEGQEHSIYFDKNSVKKNGEPHRFISFIDVLEKKPILIEVDVVNETGESNTIEVDWRLYDWDSVDDINKINSIKKEYNIPANSTTTISYTIEDIEKTVYMVSPIISNDYGNSFLNIRMQIYDIDTPRVNYPAVYNYPLIKDEENIFFACLHNTGTSRFVDGSLFEVYIEDENGDIIYQYEYDGKIPVSMTGFADSFVPKRDIENFSIKTKLYKDDVLISEDEIVYNCEDINPYYCEKDWFKKVSLLNIFIVILVMLLILLIINKNKSKK